jgi:hypothetical protein
LTEAEVKEARRLKKNARQREYGAANREMARAYASEYRAKYPEKIKVCAREYRAKYREKIRASSRKYQAENPLNPEKRNARNARIRGRYAENTLYREKVRAHSREYQAENPERVKAYNREYQAEKSEKISARKRKRRIESPWKDRAAAAARRALKLKATPRWANTPEHRAAIRAFFKNCPRGYHVDHIFPLKAWKKNGEGSCGLHVLWNLQYLPDKVNISKGNKLCLNWQSALTTGSPMVFASTPWATYSDSGMPFSETSLSLMSSWSSPTSHSYSRT